MSEVAIYTDYKLDESYTPTRQAANLNILNFHHSFRISVRGGTNFNDLQEIEVENVLPY